MGVGVVGAERGAGPPRAEAARAAPRPPPPAASRRRPASRWRSRPFPSGPRRPARPVPHDTASAANFFHPILPRPERDGKWRPRRGVSWRSGGGLGAGGAGGSMTRWVPTKREEKYGVGEHLRAPRAGLRAAGGAPRSLLQAARAGTRSDRGARSPASPALPLCPGGPIALPSAGTAHSAPGAHAVPELAPEPARAGPGTRGCVWVCVWGGTRRVVSRPEGVPSDTQLSGRAPRRPNPPASRGLPPDSPIPAGPGPAGRPPGALFSRAFFFFLLFG